MKTILLLLIVALAVTNGQTFCEKYSTLLMVNNSALVSIVVDDTIGAVVNTSNGIAKYFNGGVSTGIDYTNPANSAQLTALRTGLIQFFGGALGCSDGSIAPYTVKDITPFHTHLNIGFLDYFKFNNLLLNVMLNRGVIAADVAVVAGVLDTLRKNCCVIATDCFSVCNKLIVPGLGSSLPVVTAVVNASVMAAVSSPILLPYFNGKIGTRGDFTVPAKFNNLFSHLVQFFGKALGCTDGTIAEYTGLSLKESHTGLNINLEAFNLFNAAIMNVMVTAIGPTWLNSADYMAVYTLLNSTKSDVCTAPDCGTSTVSSSGASSTNATSAGTSAGTSSATSAGTSGATSSATTTPAPSSSTGDAQSIIIGMTLLVLSLFI